MIKRFVTLKELPDGRWLWAEHGRYYGALVIAVRMVRRDDRLTADAGHNVITVITYEPCTDAGTETVKALTG